MIIIDNKNSNMNRLKAEEARKIANDNSEIIQEEMDKILHLIEQTARLLPSEEREIKTRKLIDKKVIHVQGNR